MVDKDQSGWDVSAGGVCASNIINISSSGRWGDKVVKWSDLKKKKFNTQRAPY
jgi:hypothetical protein